MERNQRLPCGRTERATARYSFLKLALVISISLCAGSHTARAVSKEAVSILMDYAFALLPNEVITNDDKRITIDRGRKKEIQISLDVAHNVAKVSTLSALAHLCGRSTLSEEFTELLALLPSGAFTEQQQVFIQQFHVLVFLLLTEKLTIESAGDGVLLTRPPATLAPKSRLWRVAPEGRGANQPICSPCVDGRLPQCNELLARSGGEYYL